MKPLHLLSAVTLVSATLCAQEASKQPSALPPALPDDGRREVREILAAGIHDI